MIKWGEFTHKENTYSLKHVHPFEHEFIVPSVGGKPEIKYKIKIRFGLHCFTRGKKGTEDPLLFYKDNRECRIFCFDRYELSKRLRIIVTELLDRKCYHTGKSNYFTVDLIDKDGKEVGYEVYFIVSKCTNEKGVLNLYIQSAYPRTRNISTKKKKPIKFKIIAYNTMTGKDIKLSP